MSRLIAVPDHIAQARRIEGCTPPLPWASLADFSTSRVYDRTLIHRPFLTYCDDDASSQYTYTYAQFGTVVQEAAAFLHHHVGLRRGDRLATVLFNHDVTVILYFAAWLSGGAAKHERARCQKGAILFVRLRVVIARGLIGRRSTYRLYVWDDRPAE